MPSLSHTITTEEVLFLTKIHIYLQPRRLELWESDILLQQYPVAIGKEATPTPLGEFQVLALRKNPGDALGTRWIQFTWLAHGIHGTNQPWLIGQAVSLGCVRMHNHEVENLYEYISIGTPITIGQNSPKEIPFPDETNYKPHIVSKGDTLWLLSQKYNIPLEDLIAANTLVNPNNLYIGQTIKIPIF